jgi:hypothetical protein
MYYKLIGLGKNGRALEKSSGSVIISCSIEKGMVWDRSGGHINWEDKKVSIPWKEFMEIVVLALPNYIYKKPSANGDPEFDKLWTAQDCPREFTSAWFNCKCEAGSINKDNWTKYLRYSQTFYGVVRFFETNIRPERTDVIWKALKFMINIGFGVHPEYIFSTQILGRGVYPFLMANQREDLIYKMLDILLYFSEVNYRDSRMETLASSLALFLNDLIQGRKEGYFKKETALLDNDRMALAYLPE